MARGCSRLAVKVELLAPNSADGSRYVLVPKVLPTRAASSSGALDASAADEVELLELLELELLELELLELELLELENGCVAVREEEAASLDEAVPGPLGC